jgi:hypothetical protein
MPGIFRYLRGLPLAALFVCGSVQAMTDIAAVRVIVSYRDGPSAASAVAANRAVGVRVLRPLASGNAAVVELPAGMTLDEGLRRLAAQPGVRHAEADSLRRAAPIRGPKIEP